MKYSKKKTATIKDVAQKAGISTATVSKVINGSHSISEATAARVKEVIKELNYTPNKLAQSFATKKTKSIIFAAQLQKDEAFRNPYLFEIMSGSQSYLEEQGYTMILMSLQDSNYSLFADLMEQKTADGLIVHGSVLTQDFAELLQKKEFPYLAIGKPAFLSSISWIDNNNVVAGQMAARHVYSLCRRDIIFLGGLKEDTISESRWEGFQGELKMRGIHLTEDNIIRGHSTRKDGFNMMKKVLEARPNLNMVVCADNTIALGAVNALHEAKKDIPHQVSVLSFDDYPYSQIIEPPLTVVNIDLYNLGQQAAKMILEKIKHPMLQFQTFSALPELIVRDSTHVR